MRVTLPIFSLILVLLLGTGPVLGQSLDDAVRSANPASGSAVGAGSTATPVAIGSNGGMPLSFGNWFKSIFSGFPTLGTGIDKLLAGLDALLKWLLPGLGGMPLPPGIEPLDPGSGSAAGSASGAGSAVATGADGGSGSAAASGSGTPVEPGSGDLGSGEPGSGSGSDAGSGSVAPVVPTASGSADTLSLCPPRPADAETGSAFLSRTERMSRADREAAILAEIERGNMPSFLRGFREVPVTMRLRDGREHTAVFKVLPDYLAIGSDQDFVRMPMSPLTAQRLAERFGCLLPTKQMCDQIYRAAQVKLSPQPMSGGQYPNWQSRMMKNEFYGEHQRLVQSQLGRTAGYQPGQLTAGHKKDVIISNSLNQHPNQVIIYGWHQRNGQAIQPRSWIHENTYADYSHGIRLVNPTMVVDGREMRTADVLRDPVLSQLLSDEGPVNNTSARR